MRQKSCTDEEICSNLYLQNSVQLNLISYSFSCIITSNVCYIFSFHRGCARQLDHRYGDFGRFDDQCRRICGRARVFTKTSSPFGGHSAAGTGTDSELVDAIRAGVTPTTPSVETVQCRIRGTFCGHQAGLK